VVVHQVSVPVSERRLCELRLPCRHAATSQTLAVVMYSLAHSLLAFRTTFFRWRLAARCSASVQNPSLMALAATLQSSFHHRELNPGAAPTIFMVARQAELNAR
jgi:hypothetical protein